MKFGVLIVEAHSRVCGRSDQHRSAEKKKEKEPAITTVD